MGLSSGERRYVLECLFSSKYYIAYCMHSHKLYVIDKLGGIERMFDGAAKCKKGRFEIEVTNDGYAYIENGKLQSNQTMRTILDLDLSSQDTWTRTYCASKYLQNRHKVCISTG